jgi:magnesium transporter
MLSMAATVGNQSATVAVGAVRAGEFDNLSWQSVFSHLATELGVASLLGLFFGLLVSYIGHSFLDLPSLAFVMGGALFVLIVFAKVLATIIPITLYRFGIDPTVASVALYGFIADISAVGLLYGMAYVLLGM